MKQIWTPYDTKELVRTVGLTIVMIALLSGLFYLPNVISP